ncbi:MAG: type I-E CRISPR-associated protein Cse2/CasB [Candidatus Ornithospirochaeta sp.]
MTLNENSFVDYVFERKESDSSFRANLKSAIVSNLEWKAWRIIDLFANDLSDNNEREAYALVGSSIAKSQRKTNGTIKLGKAIREASKDTGDETNFPPRLLRLLSANSTEELLDVMRPTLSFLESKNIALDYKQILHDILQFRYGEDARMNVKTRWASEFLAKEDSDVSSK